MAIRQVKRLIEDLQAGALDEVKSKPPEGSYRVVNIYVVPSTGKLFVEYEGENMALQSFELDSNAAAYTPEQLVGMVNSAGTSGTGVENLSPGAAKGNLDAMAGTARGYVKTEPATGQFKVLSVQAKNNGKLVVDYDDVAMP